MRHFAILVAILLIAFGAGCGGNRSIPAAVPFQTAAESSHDAVPEIELDANSKGPDVSRDVYGASLDTWYDFRQSFVNPSLRSTGIALIRFPGGSESDAYHWESGGYLCFDSGSVTPGATFDNLMRGVAKPVKSDVAITLNYGTNRACNGGGEPSEAAAWVAHAKAHGEPVSDWTVGNESYGSWEEDLHAKPHDPHTYSKAVHDGYYPAVKKADSNAQLGVVVDLPTDRAWNDVVLQDAQPFDFVELHYYPEYQKDNDAFLLGAAVDNFAGDIAGLRRQIRNAGLPSNFPIYLGEYNNDAGEEGKQSVSITNGLFVGEVLGTLMEAGVPRATFWLAYGSCDESGDFSKKLYGWQHFGSEALFSDGLPNPYESCANTPKIPGGTPFPTARVMALMAKEIPAGSHVRVTHVAKSLGKTVRAYGFAQAGGFAFAIFNNTLSSVRIDANVQGSGRSKFTATLWTYGKAEYDRSKGNEWIGPRKQSMGSVGASVPLTLPPYSLSVLLLR